MRKVVNASDLPELVFSNYIFVCVHQNLRTEPSLLNSPPRDVRCLQKEHRLFVQLAFTEPQSFL
jgi:hypothetical protein